MNFIDQSYRFFTAGGKHKGSLADLWPEGQKAATMEAARHVFEEVMQELLGANPDQGGGCLPKYMEAPTLENLVPVADAIGDSIVVLLQLAYTLGVPIHYVLAVICKKNLEKIGPDGTVLRNENGKILKPEGWVPPEADIMQILLNVQALEQYRSKRVGADNWKSDDVMTEFAFLEKMREWNISTPEVGEWASPSALRDTALRALNQRMPAEKIQGSRADSVIVDDISEQPAPAVRDGWKMVPVEPTPEMGEAYLAAAKIHAAHGRENVMRFSVGGYQAMLSAAPDAQPAKVSASSLPGISKSDIISPLSSHVTDLIDTASVWASDHETAWVIATGRFKVCRPAPEAEFCDIFWTSQNSAISKSGLHSLLNSGMVLDGDFVFVTHMESTWQKENQVLGIWDAQTHRVVPLAVQSSIVECFERNYKCRSVTYTANLEQSYEDWKAGLRSDD